MAIERDVNLKSVKAPGGDYVLVVGILGVAVWRAVLDSHTIIFHNLDKYICQFRQIQMCKSSCQPAARCWLTFWVWHTVPVCGTLYHTLWHTVAVWTLENRLRLPHTKSLVTSQLEIHLRN